MLKEFNDNWVKKDEDFSKRAKTEIDVNEAAIKEESKLYFDNELKKIKSFKMKPNYQIKLLNNQERLLALNERVEEAVNFRNEVNYLKRKEDFRLQKLKDEAEKNLRKKVDLMSEKDS